MPALQAAADAAVARTGADAANSLWHSGATLLLALVLCAEWLRAVRCSDPVASVLLGRTLRLASRCWQLTIHACSVLRRLPWNPSNPDPKL